MAEAHPDRGFPKWKYHATKPAVVVHTSKDEKDLGAEWKNSPADFVEADKPASVPPKEAPKA